MAYCTACGHLIPTDAPFCGTCGAVQDVEVECPSQPNTTAKPPSGAPEDDQHSIVLENSRPQSTTPAYQVPTFANSTTDTPTTSGRRKKVFIGLIAAVAVMSAGLIGLYFMHGHDAPPSQQATTSQQSQSESVQAEAASTVQLPHEKTPDEVWNEASPVTRRSILASYVRRTWKDVRVENSGVLMTITHPGMDERGAQQIIGDISKLAAAAGLRRIDFVSAGGICEVRYTWPYCELACSEQGYCLPSESHPCLTCCLIYGSPIEHIPAVRQELCPSHTWVYHVPSS